MSGSLIIGITLAYLGLLFGIAYFANRLAKRGRRWVSNAYIYSLSLAVYCTAWTFFGSVGRAATEGLSFLPIYLGPTIVAPIWILVWRKVILISKNQRLTSVADFLSSRYGKSTWLGVLATTIAVFGVIPYISIQLKAITAGLDTMLYQSTTVIDHSVTPFYQDSALYITIVLAVFAILFGTRHLDPNERHVGLVAAIAFESVLKLLAFLAIGIFVTFYLFDGFQDLFTQAAALPEVAQLWSLQNVGVDGWEWFWLIMLSLFAFMLLPRQFHVAVVENENPGHLQTASWLLPLYLLLINLFVLPIAVAGLTLFQGGSVEPDTYVLMLPLLNNQQTLAILAAVGGFSAATGMVIVATIALSIMISNNLVLPALLRREVATDYGTVDLSSRLLGIRRLSIIVVLLFAYSYYKSVGSDYSLVSIGLVSFTAVAQFAPTFLAALYWKRATKVAAFSALGIGFLVWAYTLLLPTMIEVGLFDSDLIEQGLFGLSWLRPYALFGMEGVDQISHAAFWSLSLNSLALLVVSLNSRPSTLEITQADLFVDIHKYVKGGSTFDVIRRRASVEELLVLMARCLGDGRTATLIQRFEKDHQIDLSKETAASTELISFVETHLAGAIGAASAKVIISTVAKEDPISLEEVFEILDQTQEIIQYSRALEKKSDELEQTTFQLRTANEQLKELDLLKADFITTVTHELRTPITSIKALSKIIQDNKDLPLTQQEEFLGIIVGESERISRLINQVLDLERIQAASEPTSDSAIDLREVVETALKGVGNQIEQKGIRKFWQPPTSPILVNGNSDRLIQVVVNILSNAVKFCPSVSGTISIELTVVKSATAQLIIQDNGPGVPATQQRLIFEKFTQLTNPDRGKPQGSGLGLYISRHILEQHRGSIWVENAPEGGASFYIHLPLNPA